MFCSITKSFLVIILKLPFLAQSATLITETIPKASTQTRIAIPSVKCIKTSQHGQ